VGEAEFLEDIDLVPPAVADGAGGPFADAVHGQDGGAFVGGGIEGAAGVRFVVLGEEDFRRHGDAGLLEGGFDLGGNPQLLLHPDRQGHHEGLEALGGDPDVGFEDAGELVDRLVVEGHGVELAGSDAALGEAVADGVGREIGIVLLAREALLLGGGDDPAVANEGGGGVVVKGADAENVH